MALFETEGKSKSFKSPQTFTERTAATHLSCRYKAAVAHKTCLPTILCESFVRMRPSGLVRLAPSSRT